MIISNKKLYIIGLNMALVLLLSVLTIIYNI